MAYDRVNWINEQEGTTTPLNAENLNTMDEGIANLDERVTELEEAPAPTTDAFSVVKVGNVEIEAEGADTFTLKAGQNVTMSANAETKEITINSTGGGGGGGGHEMLSTVEAVEAVTDQADNHVVSAYVIKNYSNRYTNSVITTISAGDNTITINNDIFKDDSATFEFMFEPTLNSSSEYEVMTLNKYTLDTSAGTLTLELQNAPTVNTRIRVDVSVYRA